MKSKLTISGGIDIERTDSITHWGVIVYLATDKSPKTGLVSGKMLRNAEGHKAVETALRHS